MKKIVSLALFGERYSHYLPSFVRAHLNIFPQDENWTLRIHVDHVVYGNSWGDFLSNLARKGLLEYKLMSDAPLSKASLWRMLPVFEDGVDYVFSRDIDAIPMPRDKLCCEEFMASGAVVHTIHDHLHHVNIMAGLCGFKAKAFREALRLNSLDELYINAQRTDAQWLDKETDQHVLNRLLLSPWGPELFEHRYNGWFYGPDTYTARPPGSYPCQSRSEPVSNSERGADYLGAHLGCAGYDVENAIKFWNEYGDPKIIAAIKECE